ncbi:uncharacterized protein L203_103247 [Cryptococcus depauperatus CBS 7841]|uniref:Uncharacterized protein n=1 Tax=Cryptococcus depauperatus CBS 7841 TaxID=1295531 RepID=A0A1E3HQ01_9TREE|nr:hypothetical protein L203_06137 [Cryptococcus depauperatus CBS 7841]
MQSPPTSPSWINARHEVFDMRGSDESALFLPTTPDSFAYSCRSTHQKSSLLHPARLSDEMSRTVPEMSQEGTRMSGLPDIGVDNLFSFKGQPSSPPLQALAALILAQAESPFEEVSDGDSCAHGLCSCDKEIRRGLAVEIGELEEENSSEERIRKNRNRWSLDTDATLLELPPSPTSSTCSVSSFSNCALIKPTIFRSPKSFDDGYHSPIVDVPKKGMRPLLLLEKRRSQTLLKKSVNSDSSILPIRMTCHDLDTVYETKAEVEQFGKEFVEQKPLSRFSQIESVHVKEEYTSVSCPDSASETSSLDDICNSPVVLPSDVSLALSSLAGLANIWEDLNDPIALLVDEKQDMKDAREEKISRVEGRKSCFKEPCSPSGGKAVRFAVFDTYATFSSTSDPMSINQQPSQQLSWVPALLTASRLPTLISISTLFTPTATIARPKRSNVPLSFLLFIISFLSDLISHAERGTVYLAKAWVIVGSLWENLKVDVHHGDVYPYRGKNRKLTKRSRKSKGVV